VRGRQHENRKKLGSVVGRERKIGEGAATRGGYVRFASLTALTSRSILYSKRSRGQRSFLT